MSPKAAKAAPPATPVDPPSPVGFGTTTQSKASPTSFANPLICHDPDMHITNSPDLKKSMQLFRLSPTNHTSGGVMPSSCHPFNVSENSRKPGVSTVKFISSSNNCAPMLIAGPAKRCPVRSTEIAYCTPVASATCCATSAHSSQVAPSPSSSMPA